MFGGGALPAFYLGGPGQGAGHKHPAGPEHRVQSGGDPQHPERPEKGGADHGIPGTGGAELCRDPAQITLHQIYTALEPKGLSCLIGIHPCDGRACPVAKNIRRVLQRPYRQIGEAIAHTMDGITLASMIEDLEAGLDATPAVQD